MIGEPQVKRRIKEIDASQAKIVNLSLLLAIEFRTFVI